MILDWPAIMAAVSGPCVAATQSFAACSAAASAPPIAALSSSDLTHTSPPPPASAVRSAQLTSGRAGDRRGAGWPWCRSVSARVGLLSTALNRALARRAQRIAGRRRRSRRRRQLIRRRRIEAVVDRRCRNHTPPGVDTLVAARRGRGAGQDLVRIAVPGVGAQRHIRLSAAAFPRCRRPLTGDVHAGLVECAAYHVALAAL